MILSAANLIFLQDFCTPCDCFSPGKCGDPVGFLLRGFVNDAQRNNLTDDERPDRGFDWFQQNRTRDFAASGPVGFHRLKRGDNHDSRARLTENAHTRVPFVNLSARESPRVAGKECWTSRVRRVRKRTFLVYAFTLRIQYIHRANNIKARHDVYRCG